MPLPIKTSPKIKSSLSFHWFRGDRIWVIAFFFSLVGIADGDVKKSLEKNAAVSTINSNDLAGFDQYPLQLKELVNSALELTRKNLRYEFGSADPKRGGMDCSGAIYYLLKKAGMKDVPRQSDEICMWVMQKGVLYRTENVGALTETAFQSLKPGDLLFWSGTYETNTVRELPISHVMLYLGKRKSDGKAVVFGASDGRTYDGQRRNGVSVFDFSLPQRGGMVEFYGYGSIPAMRHSSANTSS